MFWLLRLVLVGVLIMAHGAPDDSDVLKEIDQYRVDDMAELAARLGSIFTYRRSGQVMLLEDFSAGLAKWDPDPLGAGAEIALQGDYARSAGVSSRHYTPMGGATSAYLRGYYPVWGMERIAIQCEMSIEATAEEIILQIVYEDGAMSHTWALMYNASLNTLSYWGVGPAYHVIDPELNLYQFAGVFHNLRLVADLGTLLYGSLYVDSQEYPMAAIPAYSTMSVGPRYLRFTVGSRSALLVDGIVYFDNIVLTRGEI